MKTLLLTLLLAAPLLAGEMTAPPSDGGSLSYTAVGTIVGAALAAYLGYAGGKARACRVQGEIKELKDFATRDELETLRENVNHDLRNMAAEIGSAKSYTSEIKGELKVIADTQQQILNLLLNK